MKVLYITTNVPESPLRYMASMPHIKVSNLPCQVVECRDIECVREHANTSEVVLFNSVKRVIPFIGKTLFLNKLADMLIGTFPTDPQRDLYWDRRVRCDMIISPRSEAANRYGKRPMSLVFWSPCCCDVQDYNLSRDIDILWWGNWSGYPFRTFIIDNCFRKYSISNPIKLGRNGNTYKDGRRYYGSLAEFQLVIGGRTYKWVTVPTDPRFGNWKPFDGYYGKKLYSVISRAKVCTTGPHFWKGPLGRYFENSTCGAVTITCDFTQRAALGFEHRKNIWITDEAHFMDDLTFLLTHNDVREDISKNARDLIRARHTPKIRARELYEFLCEKTGKT